MINVPHKTRLYRSEAWFVFEDGPDTIALRCSRLSARQDLFINGQRYSSRQSYGQFTRHIFMIGLDKFELNLNIENRQYLTARLVKNDQTRATQNLAPRWLLEKLNKRVG